MGFTPEQLVSVCIKIFCGAISMSILVFCVFPNIRKNEITRNGKCLLSFLLFYIMLMAISHLVEATYISILHFTEAQSQDLQIEPLRISWIIQIIFVTAQVGCTATYTFELLEVLNICQWMKKFQDKNQKTIIEFALIMFGSVAAALWVLYNQRQTSYFILVMLEMSPSFIKYQWLCFMQSLFLIFLTAACIVARWKLNKSRASLEKMETTSLDTKFNRRQYFTKLERLLPMVVTKTALFALYVVLEYILLILPAHDPTVQSLKLVFSPNNKFPIICLLLVLSAVFGTRRVLKKKLERVEQIELDMKSHQAKHYFDNLAGAWN